MATVYPPEELRLQVPGPRPTAIHRQTLFIDTNNDNVIFNRQIVYPHQRVVDRVVEGAQPFTSGRDQTETNSNYEKYRCF
jgi:hypothetical protein